VKLSLTFEKEFDELYESFANSQEGLQLLDLDGISPRKIDVGQMSHDYFTKRLADSSVDMNANANEELSANNYQSEVTKGVLKLEGYYLLWRYSKKRFGLKRANKLMSAIWDGDLYFHDASGHGIQIPYCFAFSTSPLMHEGRPYGQLYSIAPKRADSFMAQAIEVCMDLSQEFAGAIAPSDLLVNYAYYAKRENLSDKDILNDMQKFVHVTNNKFRVSGQSPFVNISLFDLPNLKKLFGKTPYPDGSYPDLDYIMYIQKLFGTWFAKGDPSSNLPYRFPVATVNMSVDKNRNPLDEEFLDFLSRSNVDKCVFNIYANEGSKIAMCCRYINNMDRMDFRADSFGNGGINIGSHRIVTINYPKLALQAVDKEHFFKLLDEKANMAKDLLLVHREEILQRRIKKSFLKFFKPLNWFTLDMLFSTIGITGTYEMCHFLGVPMETEEGQMFTAEVLKRTDDYALQFSKETGHSFNTEEIPGESTAITFANKDRLLFSEEKQPFPMYSNQYIPLISDMGMVDRIKLTGKFMKYLSGGGILHLNIQDKIDSTESMKKLIRMTLREGVEHFAINYGFGICEDNHTSVVGNGKICPICNKPIKDYLTRIIGYFTKISSWNTVRKDYEYPKRKFL